MTYVYICHSTGKEYFMNQSTKEEQLIVLGTGNAQAIECYNTCFALREEEQFFLVDTGGGNGILRQLKRANIPLQNIHDIFITHEHTDHILGIVWLIRFIATDMKKGNYDGNLTIYCHSGLPDVIRTICSLTIQAKFYQFIDDRILFCSLEDGDSHTICGLPMTFFDIHSTKAKQFGFTTTLHNDKKFTCMGDEPCLPPCYAYAKDSDWMLHEAFCLYKDREKFKPYEKNHSTVMDACKLAEELNIRNVVLWHTEDSKLADRKVRYTEEGLPYFSGNIFVPDDLEVIDLSIC